MLDAVQVQDCKNKQIEQSRAFARSYYNKRLSFCPQRGVWQTTPLSRRLLQRTVRILLECILDEHTFRKTVQLFHLCVMYLNMRHRIYSFRACADHYTETFSGGVEIIKIYTFLGIATN